MFPMQPLSVCLQLDKICVRRNATGPNSSEIQRIQYMLISSFADSPVQLK